MSQLASFVRCARLPALQPDRDCSNHGPSCARSGDAGNSICTRGSGAARPFATIVRDVLAAHFSGAGRWHRRCSSPHPRARSVTRRQRPPARLHLRDSARGWDAPRRRRAPADRRAAVPATGPAMAGALRREQNRRGAMFANQREIVHGGHNRDAALYQSPQQSHQFDLASEVQVLGRLIQQHELGLLRQANGDLHPLAFAAREFGKDALAHAEDIDRLHGAFNRLQIALREAARKSRDAEPGPARQSPPRERRMELPGAAEPAPRSRRAGAGSSVQAPGPAPGSHPRRDAAARRPASAAWSCRRRSDPSGRRSRRAQRKAKIVEDGSRSVGEADVTKFQDGRH